MLVSIVIPTYNYGHFVATAVESALGQTYPAVEVIVVDDGSTDDTRTRLAGYGDRIRYIYQKNAGLSAARNTGIRAAAGTYVAFLDSDDVFHQLRVELQMRVFESDPTIGLVSAHNTHGTEISWDPIPPNPPVDIVTLEDLVLRTRFGSCGVLARKSCFESVGYFDETLRSVEDRDMWIRIAASYRVACVRASLWWYRTNPGSMSRNAERMEQFERIVLDKAFRMPKLAGRFSLRRKAMGMADLSNCLAYREAGRLWTAFGRLLRSFVWWPFWYHRFDTRGTLVRPRVLIAILRQAFAELILRRQNMLTLPV